MITAIADIHGDYERAVELLAQVNLVDKNGRWIGGTNTLVCTGDSVDRGEFGWKVLQWFFCLEQEAKAAGGQVIHLTGNHDAWMVAEVWNALRVGEKFKRIGYDSHRMDIMYLVKHPVLFEWYRTRPLICRVGTTLFQHADSYIYTLAESLQKDGLGGDELLKHINTTGVKLLSREHTALKLGDEITHARDWENREDLIQTYLNIMGAERVVHGHTAHNSPEPWVYLNGRVVNIDGHMSFSHIKRGHNHGFVYQHATTNLAVAM